MLCLAWATMAVGADEPYVENIRVAGVPEYSQPVLLDLLYTHPGGWFSKRTFYPDLLDQDVTTLVTFLRYRGYLSARVDSVEVEAEPQSGATDITIYAEAGPRTHIDSVRFAGNTIFPEDTLRSLLWSRPGRPYDKDHLDEDNYLVLARYMRGGYINASVTPETDADTLRRLIDITFRIREGPRARVKDIAVEGLDKTRRYVVMREVSLRPGDIFNYAEVVDTQSRLYQTGLFRRVDVAPDPADTLDLTSRRLLITVVEREAGEFAAGVGYSTEGRERAEVRISQQNFRGMAQTLIATGRVSRIEQRVETAFSEPRLRGTRLAITASASGGNRREPSFSERRGGGSLTLTRPLSEATQVQGRYSLEVSRLANVRIAEPLRGKDGAVSQVRLSLTRDTRNDFQMPRRGALLELQSGFAGKFLRGTIHFIRTRIGARVFHPLGRRLILAAQYNAGLIVGLNPTRRVSLQERFLLGGAQNVRGFSRNMIGPRDAATNRPVGGNTTMYGTIELRTLFTTHLMGVTFFDAGNVWEDVHAIHLDDMRGSYGAGLRVATLLGAVGVDYGRKVARRGDESSGTIHVAVGFTF